MYIYKMREARKKAGKTQEQAAEILETTQRQISKWETQTQDITLQKAIKLALFYEVSLDYLAGLIDNQALTKGRDDHKQE